MPWQRFVAAGYQSAEMERAGSLLALFFCKLSYVMIITLTVDHSYENNNRYC